MIKNIFNVIKNSLKPRSKTAIVELPPVAETAPEPVKKKAGRPKKVADAPSKKSAPKKKTA